MLIRTVGPYDPEFAITTPLSGAGNEVPGRGFVFSRINGNKGFFYLEYILYMQITSFSN